MDTGNMTPEDKPLCTVCIANYEGERYVASCIESVLTQDCGFPVEIIVHDDASSDGSVALIKERFPQVILIESKGNVGYCTANRRMSELARGDYLLLLNNDATLFPDALRRLLAEARSLGIPAILGLPQYDAATGLLEDRGRLCDPFLNPIHNLDPDRKEVAMVGGACLWLPVRLWRELGGMPEWFGTLAEDLFLACLARLRGYPVRVLTISGYRHWIGASLGGGAGRGGLDTTVRRRALSERNKCFTLLLCYPAPWQVLAFACHVPLLLVEGIILSIVKRDFGIMRKIYWWAVKEVWRERKRLLGLRREIQSNRRIGSRAFFSAFKPVLYKLRLLARFGMPQIRY